MGVASYTFSNVVSDLSITASYGGVSASCTITTSSIIYAPALDGTETWKSINSSYQPTYSTDSGVNKVCSACGYLLDGWDNTGNWKLTFEYYHTASGTIVYSGALITFPTITARDRYSIQFWAYSCNNHQGTGSASVFNSQTVCPANVWNKVEITKNGSSFTLVMNDTNTYTFTNTNFSDSSRTIAVIGLDATGTGTTSCIRNIVVESI